MTKEKIEQIKSDAMYYQGDEEDGGPEYYTAGATAEATKAEGLVKVLEELSMFQQTVNHGWDITRVREIATAALTAYQLSQKVNK